MIYCKSVENDIFQDNHYEPSNHFEDDKLFPQSSSNFNISNNETSTKNQNVYE